MSLTYADFLYYFGERENSNSMNPIAAQLSYSSSFSSLPKEFQVLGETQVPLLQTADDTYQDFIIIAEFSELEGPTPLCTIPNDAPSKTDINLNSLAVHLMSTDYQVNTVGHFKVCEDTQVMRTNVFKNVHVFMQYFTLYDIKARGFVRPFCFGYVSKDHVKIDKNVSKFAAEFDKITNILKHTNRQWFAFEMQKYLGKLKMAKEDYIQAKTQNSWQPYSTTVSTNMGTDEPQIFSLDDSSSESESISLNQIARQYTEIESILQIVKSTPYDSSCENEVKLLSFHVQHLPPRCNLRSTLQNFRIRHLGSNDDSNHGADEEFEQLNMPLVHPLKQKGESLRPLTTLGQLGTVVLVWRLMRLEFERRSDTILSEMDVLAREFQKQCKVISGSKSPLFEASIQTVISDRTVLLDSAEIQDNSLEINSNGDYANEDDNGADDYEDEHFELLLNEELCRILDKLHTSVPIIPDNKSGSYHSLSDESDIVIPSRHVSGNENESSSYTSAIGSVESVKNVVDDASFKTIPSEPPEVGEQGSVVGSTESRTLTSDLLVASSSLSPVKVPVGPVGTRRHSISTVDTPSDPRGGDSEKQQPPIHHDRTVDTRCSVSSFSSSEDDFSFSSGSSDFSSGSVEVIEKTRWYQTMARKMSKGQPGYGMLKFFRHFFEVAHHVLYSIVIGRPVVVCGSESYKPRVSQILTALIPLVSCHPEKCWKLLRWHRGILVPAHFKHNSVKLIGLCIPERLVVHDLISAKDVSSVTILNAETKQILGPAYSGSFFANFEQRCQKLFSDDVSLMGYLGCVFAEIESKVFLYKSLLSDGMKSSEIIRQMDLKGTDVDIVKHLAGLLQDVESVVEIF